MPSSVKPDKVPVGNIQGSVHGGQAPISGAQIYLFAAGTGGYGTAATSLIASGKPGVTCNTSGALNGDCYVLTDSNGNFALGGDYTCTQGTQVYMVAVGGNPGLTGGTVNNTAIVQMAGLGQCPAAGNLAAQVPWLTINEVTTVALAYAMGGFGSTAYNISSNATNSAASATAIANAMANAGNIVNVQWGQAPAVANGNSNSVNPQAEIYALANILAGCVNTSSSTSSACTSLFNTAKSSTGVAATDEANAIFNIVHNPANTSASPTHVADIYNLIPSTPAFSYVATPPQPTDWTLPVIYKGLVSQPGTNGNNQIVSGPFDIAFDASGNAWIGDRVNGVVEIGPQGASNTFNNNGTGPFGMVKGVAVSPLDGTIWVSDYGANTLYVMSNTGSILQTITTNLTGNGPIMTAFSSPNPGGHTFGYEATETNTGIGLFDASTFASEIYVGSGNLAAAATPGWISVDNNGNAWIPSTSTTFVGEYSYEEKGSGPNYNTTNSNVRNVESSYATVSDSAANVWISSITGTATIQKIGRGGGVTGSFTGGGMNGPFKLAVDGANTLWVSNAGANTVSALDTASGTWLTPSGFSTSAQAGTGCVVATPDPSGNLWSANSDGSVTQLLGLATPTAAPLMGGALSNHTTITGNLGSKP